MRLRALGRRKLINRRHFAGKVQQQLQRTGATFFRRISPEFRHALPTAPYQGRQLLAKGSAIGFLEVGQFLARRDAELAKHWLPAATPKPPSPLPPPSLRVSPSQPLAMARASPLCQHQSPEKSIARGFPCTLAVLKSSRSRTYCNAWPCDSRRLLSTSGKRLSGATTRMFTCSNKAMRHFPMW